MFRHDYLLALKALSIGRSSLVAHFAEDEENRNWKLLNRIIDANPQTDEIIRKIFFLEEVCEFLSKIQNLNTVTEGDFSERCADARDLENLEYAIKLYLNSENTIDIKQHLSQMQLSQYISLLDSSMSLDRKYEMLKNKFLMEKRKFEKEFQYYSQLIDEE